MRAQIELETMQTVDGEAERLLHHASGILRKQADSAVLSFLLEDVHHEMRLNMEEQSLALVRNRRKDGEILYRAGHCHTVLYETPAGEMELGFDCGRVRLTETEEGGYRAELFYRLLQYGRAVADCELRIAILPAK